MKLLKELNIMGRKFDVEYFDFDDRLQVNESVGNFDYIDQKIQIDTGSHKELQESALLHEILHVVLETMKIGLIEEDVVRLHSSLYQVLKDNDLFAKECECENPEASKINTPYNKTPFIQCSRCGDQYCERAGKEGDPCIYWRPKEC